MKNKFELLRMPRAYDREVGADAVAGLGWPEPEQRAFLSAVAGSSPHLAALIAAHGTWLQQALDAPREALEQEIQDISAQTRSVEEFEVIENIPQSLRIAKGRVSLLTALCDVAGTWSLEEVTQALTRFAEGAVDLALKAEIAKLIRRGKLPGKGEEAVAMAAGLTVLAMGKMGAYELNYSSDIDLICMFDEGCYDRSHFLEVRQMLVRATRNMCATLSERTQDGYVFRTDLRLRPDPAVTPVVVSMEAAERYYESLGRTWERAAYIKARVCAGDIGAGDRFLQGLRPFIWRRHLDFAAIEDAHNMRLQIREAKGTGGPLEVPGHDMKLGRGGIREIEFFTQTRQLIAGGRDETLRVRGTVAGLQALAGQGWISPELASQLADHYRHHREVEHRIQMIHDAQTHRMPQGEEGMARVACLMGLAPNDMRAQVKARLEEVHHLTEDFFAPQAAHPVLAQAKPRPALSAELDRDVIARWRSYPALRSDRGARIFDRLKPELFARLARTANPNEALLALDGFLKGLPAGVQLFSLFEANPHLVDLLVDVVGTAPDLAAYLSRHSGVFDAVLDGGFFAPWPGLEALRGELADQLSREGDYENQLDLARRWNKEWHFRIGVHHLRGLIEAAEAGQQYAELAEATVSALYPCVVVQFAAKHGPPPGRGGAVLAMGSLGAGRLNAQSDLDLIMIYDPEDAERSEGPRALGVRPYFARLTQAMVTALTAPMAQGRLYEVDMRLRPSGNQGPVATSWRSFCHYQDNEAWTWEHLALTRARVICGEAGLAQDIEIFRSGLLDRQGGRARDAILRDVAEMRARLAAAKTPAGIWDAKTGPGRMMDLELIAQTGMLLAGGTACTVSAGLQGGVQAGWLEAALALRFQRAYEQMWRVQSAGRLIAGKGIEAAAEAEGGSQFLLRGSGFDHIGDLHSHLGATYEALAQEVARVLETGVAPETNTILET